ncbi:MAG: hypothetical protein J6Y62_05380 [Clostridia bacterium]|nr:hypothetical protein [Clostridia bacterium]
MSSSKEQSGKNSKTQLDDQESKSRLEEIMSINVDNLREKQYKAFKKHVLVILDNISNIIRSDGDLEKVVEMLDRSPAGDGYGSDNNYIQFGFESQDESKRDMDIGDACRLLSELKGDKKTLKLPSDRF